MRKSNDIETALQSLLETDGFSASAHALPKSLSFPHVHVTRTGGYTMDMVVEYNMVDFDVYAQDPADSMTTASDLCAWVRNLGAKVVGSYCYASEISTIPYDNPDPRHPNIGRTTFKAQILTRTKE